MTCDNPFPRACGTEGCDVERELNRDYCILCRQERTRKAQGSASWAWGGSLWHYGETVREGLKRLWRGRARRSRRLAKASIGHDQGAVRAVYSEARALEREDGIPRHVHHIIPIAHGGPHAANNLLIMTEEAHRRHHANNPTRSNP